MMKPNLDRAVSELSDLIDLAVFVQLWMEGHHDLEEILA